MGQENRRQSKTDQLVAASSATSSAQISTVVIPILILGHDKVGKTTLIRKFVFGDNSAADVDEAPNNGYRKRIAVNNSPQTLEIFDEAGGHNYDMEAIHTAIKNVEAFVIVYEVDSEVSFEKVQEKYNLIESVTEGTSAPIVIVANKADLDKVQWKISSEQGKTLGDRMAHGEYVEVSAKTGFNVDKLFERVGELAVIKRRPPPPNRFCKMYNC